MDNLIFGGTSGVLVLAFYAVLMLVIGYFAGRRQPSARNTAKGYYIAGGGLGFVALFFTLYATQYSGNSVIGYAPTAYRTGFPWWQSVGFMTAVIVGYLLFAPRLYVIAKREGFITPTDWVRHRFGSTPVSVVVVILMLWGLANYLLEQLVAMGHAISGLTGNTVPYQLGVIAFVLVMLIYSWMGGMRAVALTDIMQGIALLIGITVLLIGALYLAGGNLGEIVGNVLADEPEKVAVPPAEVSVNWIAMMLLIGFGSSVYPHAIQRIYAARSERTLKRSFAIMAWMPFVTTGVVFLVGIIGTQLYPGLSESESEQLVGRIANSVAGLGPVFYAVMVLMFGGIVAAIVSTADSALLAFSSIFSRDLYGRFLQKEPSENRQLLVGKAAGVVVIGLLLLIAWNPPGTLYAIFVLKFELLVQIAPAFVLGIYWRRLASGPLFWGMLTGAVFAGTCTVVDLDQPFGIPFGLIGLAVNVVICVLGSLLLGGRSVGSAGSSGSDGELGEGESGRVSFSG
ncbi:sodium:solute symporter family protein [Prauserella rugosa]|uniref:SSS family solute:Na+ symporter/sodium/pantothenate symporter n=1 Tax=Prauserella rugosa TaxID=43354 RepID=A0A660CEW3_9PSEU|nr:sodium:solute symporter family protein [Prauserella rugosa]TWH22128.1 SSS family solute:Na+ symporter/sodium/pantothenate symporter [Prauserella rugosa]